MEHLATRALRADAKRVSLGHVHWDISGRCQAPVTLEVEGRNDAPRYSHDGNIVEIRGRHYWTGLEPKAPPLVVTMDLRCRRCPACLEQRGRMWRSRAATEIIVAPRTWFGTLTLEPTYASRAKWIAQMRAEKGGNIWQELSLEQRYRLVQSSCSAELTRWLKRVRKESEAKLRYLLVAEAHKSGDPHWHVLIHEVFEGGSVKERTLRKQWTAGFSKFNLVTGKAASAYVTKYLTKSSLARVRASKNYGNSR